MSGDVIVDRCRKGRAAQRALMSVTPNEPPLQQPQIIISITNLFARHHQPSPARPPTRPPAYYHHHRNRHHDLLHRSSPPASPHAHPPASSLGRSPARSPAPSVSPARTPARLLAPVPAHPFARSYPRPPSPHARSFVRLIPRNRARHVGWCREGCPCPTCGSPLQLPARRPSATLRNQQ